MTNMDIYTISILMFYNKLVCLGIDIRCISYYNVVEYNNGG